MQNWRRRLSSRTDLVEAVPVVLDQTAPPARKAILFVYVNLKPGVGEAGGGSGPADPSTDHDGLFAGIER